MKRKGTIWTILLLSIVLATLFVPSVVGASPAVAYNNEGISSDANARVANFDGGGSSYSNEALAGAGFQSGANVTVDGGTFQWPTVAAGTNDNWQSAGQVIPLSGSGDRVAFLGAATFGPSTGTVTITYTDNTTLNAPITLSDWTLGAGGSASVAPGDMVAATLPYRNNPAGKDNTKSYIFYTSVGVATNKTVKSVTLPSSVNQGMIHIFAVTMKTAYNPPQTSNWSTYAWSNARNSINTDEHTLTASNINNLKLKWTSHGPQGMSMQPVEANSMVYWGSWDGTFHATRTSGVEAWNASLGQTNGGTSCDPPKSSLGDTALLGTIGSTSVVYVGAGGNTSGGDGNATYYALDANTGNVIWKTDLGAAPATYLWASGTLYNGSLYVGLASFGDCPLIRGGVAQLNATTGQIQHIFYTVPSGCTGASVWSTPTIDEATGTIYFTTGNGGSCATSETYSTAMVALHASDLSFISSWQVPSSQLIGDSDFGATTILFSATINGTLRQLVGGANKNGIYYAFDRSNIAAGTVWTTTAADFNAGADSQLGLGSFGSSVWDGSTLYISGGYLTINGTQCHGSVQAIDPATGHAKWQHCLQSGPVIGALAAIPGVIVAAQGGDLNAISMSTGQTLWAYHFGVTNYYGVPPSGFFGGIAIASGQMYVGNLDGTFLTFGL